MNPSVDAKGQLYCYKCKKHLLNSTDLQRHTDSKVKSMGSVFYATQYLCEEFIEACYFVGCRSIFIPARKLVRVIYWHQSS